MRGKKGQEGKFLRKRILKIGRNLRQNRTEVRKEGKKEISREGKEERF